MVLVFQTQQNESLWITQTFFARHSNLILFVSILSRPLLARSHMKFVVNANIWANLPMIVLPSPFWGCACLLGLAPDAARWQTSVCQHFTDEFPGFCKVQGQTSLETNLNQAACCPHSVHSVRPLNRFANVLLKN